MKANLKFRHNLFMRLNRMTLYRKNFYYRTDKEDFWDKSECFGDIITIDTVFGPMEIISGKFIKPVQELGDYDVMLTSWYKVPRTSYIGKLTDGAGYVSTNYLQQYIEENDNQEFIDRLNEFISDCKEAKRESRKELKQNNQNVYRKY